MTLDNRDFLIALCFILILLSGCSTVAKQSEDGLTLKIRGTGVAKFVNGAEIERKPTIWPKIPKITYRPDD